MTSFLGCVTKKTRLVLFDHVTSQTALRLPAERLVAEIQTRGADVLIDGAHAPGMLDLHLDKLGAAYYTGNLHKWLCAPKGAAFLHVRPDRQDLIHPLSISHGHNAPPDERPRLHRLFDWTGTTDFSPFLCLEKCIEELSGLCPGGLAGLRKRNHQLAVEARRLLLDALSLPEPCPEGMLGSMAALPLPDATGPPPSSPLYSDQLQQALRERHRIEVPVIPWPRHPQRLLRISAQAYNHIDQYRRLAEALVEILMYNRGR
jgi:isopenicillin-N epimerase